MLSNFHYHSLLIEIDSVYRPCQTVYESEYRFRITIAVTPKLYKILKPNFLILNVIPLIMLMSLAKLDLMYIVGHYYRKFFPKISAQTWKMNEAPFGAPSHISCSICAS